jgi:hypothetical protein
VANSKAEKKVLPSKKANVTAVADAEKLLKEETVVHEIEVHIHSHKRKHPPIPSLFLRNIGGGNLPPFNKPTVE